MEFFPQPAGLFGVRSCFNKVQLRFRLLLVDLWDVNSLSGSPTWAWRANNAVSGAGEGAMPSEDPPLVLGVAGALVSFLEFQDFKRKLSKVSANIERGMGLGVPRTDLIEFFRPASRLTKLGLFLQKKRVRCPEIKLWEVHKIKCRSALTLCSPRCPFYGQPLRQVPSSCPGLTGQDAEVWAWVTRRRHVASEGRPSATSGMLAANCPSALALYLLYPTADSPCTEGSLHGAGNPPHGDREGAEATASQQRNWEAALGGPPAPCHSRMHLRQ